MTLKAYQKDYEHPKIPRGHYAIEPKEGFDIEYIKGQILNRNKMVLEAGGDFCQLWRKKIIGQRCTNPTCPAYNNYQAQGSPDCPICLGTGFVGGYDYLGEIFVRFAPVQEKIELTTEGVLRKREPRIWTMPKPEIRQFDIIINLVQPQIFQAQTIVDKRLIRRVDLSSNFDELDNSMNEDAQIYKIIKISNKGNGSADYTENIDYILSNNGILWQTTNRPGDMEEYFVTYQIVNKHYVRFEVKNVLRSMWRGVVLHQELDIAELNITHPAYRIDKQPFDYQYVYYPFPQSEWYERLKGTTYG